MTVAPLIRQQKEYWLWVAKGRGRLKSINQSSLGEGSLTTVNIDANLSAAPFGDIGPLLMDARALLHGQAWANSHEFPSLDSPARQAVAEIAFRMNVEANFEKREVDFLTFPDIRFYEDLTEIPWLGSSAWSLTAWGSGAAGWILNAMREVFSKSGYHDPIEGVNPTPSSLGGLAKALRILDVAVPQLARNTMPGVQLLLTFRAQIGSWYITQIPGTISLGNHILDHGGVPLVAAESLLHECLHEKYISLTNTRHIMRSTYDDSTSSRLKLPWSNSLNEKRQFRARRCLSTLHVYAHLAAFHSAVLLSPILMDHHPLARERLVFNYERGEFLLRAMLNPALAVDYGCDGLALRDWLREYALAPAEATIQRESLRTHLFAQKKTELEELLL
jgi:hypothetical protein